LEFPTLSARLLLAGLANNPFDSAGDQLSRLLAHPIFLTELIFQDYRAFLA